MDEERKDPATTTINGVVVYLNPLPTDYKDRLVWAFFNSGAIGANRASRGEEALDQLSRELKIERRDLKGYLRGILDTERRVADSVLDDDLNKLNHMIRVPASSSAPHQLPPGDPVTIDKQTMIETLLNRKAISMTEAMDFAELDTEELRRIYDRHIPEADHHDDEYHWSDELHNP